MGTVAIVAVAVAIAAAVNWARYFYRPAQWPLIGLGIVAIVALAATTDEELGTGALVAVLVLMSAIQAAFWWWSPARRRERAST